MKKLIIILMIGAGFTACKKEKNSDDNSTTSSTYNNSSTNNSTTGYSTTGSSTTGSTTGSNYSIVNSRWRVSNFEDNGNNQTVHFSGYDFKFNADGSVDATVNGKVQSGKWFMGTDDGQNKLTMRFESSPLSELNQDWHIMGVSANVINLEHVSGGNGGTQHLDLQTISS